MLIALLYLAAFVGVPLLAALYSRRIEKMIEDLPAPTRHYIESHRWD